jgi:hypothetical protein
VPAAVLIYGVLGVIPFLAPPVAGVVFPAVRATAGGVLAAYGALILSFLGGARWGLAVGRPAPPVGVVSLAMLPTLVGLGLLSGTSGAVRLFGLAAALAAHWIWDVRAADVPAWYPRLRTLLTVGAVVGLVAGGVLL